jgi:Pyruvate/2-oxoacid:ferredoxin oxidoreductase delta subunit
MDLCTGCGVCVENCPVVNEAVTVGHTDLTGFIH